MKVWQLFTLLVLGIACLGLSVATVWSSWSNQRLQQQLQLQQMRINNGIMGQRGQQLSAAILRDMGTVAVSSDDMRAILTKYGYTLNPQEGGGPQGSPAGSGETAETQPDEE